MIKTCPNRIIFERPDGQYEVGIAASNATTATPECLHPLERLRFNAFPSPVRRQSFLMGRSAAKTAANGFAPGIPDAEVCIESGVFGFPILDHPQLSTHEVSITHTSTAAMAVVYPKTHPISIDIESISDAHPRALTSYGRAHEMKRLLACGLSQVDASTLIWSAKESVGKILRTGLTLHRLFYTIDSITPSETTPETWDILYRYFKQYRSVIGITQGTAWAITFPRLSRLTDSTIISRLLEDHSD
jgi:4'-phosphopantetheinyl transferase EntD